MMANYNYSDIESYSAAPPSGAWWNENLFSQRPNCQMDFNYGNFGLSPLYQRSPMQHYGNDMYDLGDYCTSPAPKPPTPRHGESTTPRTCGFIEFFGEEFAGMEETFRSALLQYFSQVDREREDLTDELNKIKSDFRSFEEEGKQFKVDTVQKGKIIRKLTENGKLLVKEIERLKDELKDGETLRQQLIIENNELQKQVTNENDMIPLLENELKCLSEENGYLKLLADDTKKLSQQENEIRQYSNELYQKKLLCQQQASKLAKQTHALQNLSKINEELCSKLRELAELKDADIKFQTLEKRYKDLEKGYNTMKNQSEELKQLVDSLETERNDAHKEFKGMETKCKALEHEKGTLERRVEDCSRLYQQKIKKSKDHDSIVSDLQDENSELKNTAENLKNEIKSLKQNMDSMVFEDNIRNEELEILQSRSEMLEQKWNETSKREKQLLVDSTSKDYTIDCFATKEECYKHKIKSLEDKMNECRDSVSKWEIKLEHQLTREKQLENEVLTHVKGNSQMEQEMVLMYNTIETLKRNNDSCNEQRASLQKELQSAKMTILDFESQIIDDNLGSSLRKDLQELEKKYAFSEKQRFHLQDEIFKLKDKIHKNDEIVAMTSIERQSYEMLNNESKFSSIIHHKRNESVTFHTNENEQLIYNAIENEESTSSGILKVYVSRKEEEIEALTGEKQRYQDDCTLHLDEVECLKENCQILENKLEERTEYIDALTEECTLLNDNIRTRNIVITQQENEIERLQEQVNIISNNVDKDLLDTEEQGNSTNLPEKDLQITNLQLEVEHLQRNLQKYKEPKVIKDLKDENYQKELQVKTLEKRISLLEEREQRNQELQIEGHITEVSECERIDDNQETDEQEVNELLRRQIQDLECENQRINEILQASGINEAIDDYSFENEHLINKQKYSEIVESVQNKEQFIEDLKEHINLLEIELQINNNNKLDRSISTPVCSTSVQQETTAVESPRLGLRLPSPDIVPNKPTFTSKRNSLPPLPGGSNSRSESTNQRRPESLEDNTMRDVRTETTNDELRGKIIKLNADLLEKKMLLNQVEEELRVTKRKYTKMEQMHRHAVDKNECMEQGIMENRAKIRTVQSKQAHNVISEEYVKKEVQTYRENSEKLQGTCKQLRNERDTAHNELNETITEFKLLENTLDQANRQMKQWEHNNNILQAECQNLTEKCEQMQAEMLKNREQVFELNRDRDVVQNERDSWKRNIDSKSDQINELNVELGKIQDELREKVRGNEKMYEQMKIIEHERDIFENKVKDDSHAMEKLRRKISIQSKQNESLNSQIQEMKLKMESHAMESKDLMSEKEIANHNTNYLKNKVEESRSQLKEKDEKLLKLKEENDSISQELRRLTEQLKYTSVDLDNIKQEYSDETNNVSHLEKLNRDMNRENKKLMMDITETQKKMNKEVEEKDDLKKMISNFENEHLNVENMLMKTQNSNSELLDSNKSLKQDLKHTNNKLADHIAEMESTEKQKIILENKLLSLEKVFDNQARNQQKETEDMAAELQQSRAMINEFEAILDQGQLDFDEMDVQLDKYRQENNVLDQRLHETLKQQIKLQSEREEVDRRVECMNSELVLLRNSLETEKKFSLTCTKEKEILEGQINEMKTNMELHEEHGKKMEMEFEDQQESLERKENEKERFRQDLIEAQKEIDYLRSTTEDLKLQTNTLQQKESEQASAVNDLQEAEASVRDEIEQLTQQLQIKTELVEEQNGYIEQLKEDVVNNETNTEELLSQMHQLESEMENVKGTYSQEKNELLADLDNLKSQFTEREIERESTAYDVKNMEQELTEVLRDNDRLAEKLHDVVMDTEMERETMIETIAHLEEKLNNIDSDQWEELQDLRTTLQTYEQLKEDEMKELQENNEALLREDVIKTREINKLRDNLRKTESALESTKSRNNKLSRSLSDVEQEKDTSYSKLIDDLTNKEDSIRLFEEQIRSENEQRDNLMNEIEKLQDTNRNLFQEKLAERQALENETDELKNKLMNYEFLENENENMKVDIENLLTQRGTDPNTFIELSQLRAQVTALRVKGNRVDELLTENRMLKHSLRELETLKPELQNFRAESDRLGVLMKENSRLKQDIEELKNSQPVRQQQNPLNQEFTSNGNQDFLINKLTSENKNLKIENGALRQQIEVLESRIRSMESQNNGNISARMSSERIDQLTNENRSLQQQLHEMEHKQHSSSANSNSERVNHLANENRSLRQQLSEQESKQKPHGAVDGDLQRRNTQLTNENRILKQELREIENRHIQSQENLTQQNSRLQRSVDDLFKKNQDLELKSVNAVRAKPKNVVFFDQAAKLESSMKQKASSFDNLQRSSWQNNNSANNSFDFSPSAQYKTPVATSTPMQENKNFLTTSSASMKSNSMENIAFSSNQVKTSPFKNEIIFTEPSPSQQRKVSQDMTSPFSKSGPSTAPFIRQMTSHFSPDTSFSQQQQQQQRNSNQGKIATNQNQANPLKNRPDVSHFFSLLEQSQNNNSNDNQQNKSSSSEQTQTHPHSQRNVPDLRTFSEAKQYQQDPPNPFQNKQDSSKNTPSVRGVQSRQQNPFKDLSNVHQIYHNNKNRVEQQGQQQQKQDLLEQSTNQFSIEAFNLELEQDPVINQFKKQKADASWHDKPKDDGLNQSAPIRNNPFFELDKSVSQTNWKNAVKATKGKSISADNSPTKSAQKPRSQISIDFDMRPRSTEPSKRRGRESIVNTREEQPERSLEVGNDFVKRLKGVFEGQDVTGR